MTNAPLWTPTPDRVAETQLARFMRAAGDFADYNALWQWSIDEPAAFWKAVWDFAEIRHSDAPSAVMGPPAMPGTDWFPGARLNLAENLLRRDDDGTALIAVHESGQEHTLTWRELRERVAGMAAFLEAQGVGPGNRVAGFLPNRPEAIIAMLATASLGAIWSSCSPDFGFRGVMDRFGQIAPTVLVACDGYVYGGKTFSSVDRVAQVCAEIDSIRAVVVVPILGEDVSALGSRVHRWSRATEATSRPLTFAQVPFDHPLYIMYSSGTTGVPKCIVHGHGGTLLQHAKELMLQSDVRPDDVLFYFTTCGWMMWNWLVSGLMCGATLVLFDGSPGYPGPDVLWRMAERHRLTHFGTSPKFLSMCAKMGVRPIEDTDLTALRVLFSTGAPLSPELFDIVYRDVSADLQLASICGGTDIISCFMGGSPIDPVYRGEIQKLGLGMAVEAWDGPNNPVVGRQGELVCTQPFPSMPVGFWNDPDGARYRKAYFEHFPGVWRHGDFVTITERKGVVVYGRSDATLNPGGIRIGTAEIYRVVESEADVVDSIVIGQRWGEDTRVVLFVVLREGDTLTAERTQQLKRQIRQACTPRHTPAVILQVPAIPRTISGKKVEIAVTRMVHGETVSNRDALANPESLDAFAGLEALRP